MGQEKKVTFSNQMKIKTLGAKLMGHNECGSKRQVHKTITFIF